MLLPKPFPSSLDRYRKPTAPLLFVLLFAVTTTGLLHLLQVLYQASVYWVGKLALGHDLKAYYNAARSLRLQGSAYAHNWYPTFPPAAYLFLPLSFLQLHQAAILMLALNCALVPAAYFLVQELFPIKDRGERVAARCFFVLLLGFSYPFLMLADRANVDGVVAFLVALCLYLAFHRKSDRPAGAMFTFVSVIKFYPTLLAVPFLLLGKRRLLFVAQAFLIILVLVTLPSQWLLLAEKGQLADRLGLWTPWDNISVSYFVVTLGDGLSACRLTLSTDFWLIFSYLLYAGILIATIVADYRQRHVLNESEKRALCVLYIPFMFGLPKQVFPYEGVLAFLILPAVGDLLSKSTSARERRLLWGITAGVALLQFQAHAFGAVFDHSPPGLFHIIPSAGTVVLLATISRYKWVRRLRRGKRTER